MINKYAIGFVLAAGVIVSAVDYFNQSQKADLSLGEMSLTDYAGTISQRITDAKDEQLAENAERERKSRWRQGGQAYLPEAPEGWTRRALLEGDDTPIMPPEAKKFSESAGQTLLEQMEAREHVKQQKEIATRSWVYERGTESVFVEVRLRERPNSDSLIGAVATIMEGEMMGSFDRNVGYGIFGGFGLTEKLGRNGERPYHFRYLEGSIGFGHEVHLKVHANASREATVEILSRIDFDGLNNLLPEPMPTVGNDFSVPEGVDPVALSMELRRLKSDFLNLRSLEAQYRISNMDTNALLLNTYAMRLGGLAGGVDITGGKIKDLSSLVELGYRTGVQAVMAGMTAEEVQAEVKEMIDTAMMVFDAETAAAAARAANAPEPEMSPELKAELASLEVTGAQQTGADGAGGSEGRLMELDIEATRAAGYRPISKQGDVMQFRALAASMSVSDENAARSFQNQAYQFADKYGVPGYTCAFSPTNVRIECTEPMPDDVMAKLGAQNRARDMAKQQGGKALMQVDEEASDRAAGKIYSNAIDMVEYEMFKEARQATDAEMKMGMMIAAASFEKKHGLAQGTCEFNGTRLRLECDSAKQANEGGGLSGLLSKLTGGDGSKTKAQGGLKPQGLKKGEKPKRLQLSNSGQKAGKRCVGSFCD